MFGGNVKREKKLFTDGSSLGFSKKIITRSSAKINDIIITSGPFGYCSAGLKIFLNHLKADSKFTGKCRKYVNRPTPRLEFGLRIANYISSSMDSSDGLSITLNEMSRQSRKKFVITKLPTNPEVAGFAETNKNKLTDFVFCGGEKDSKRSTYSQ